MHPLSIESEIRKKATIRNERSSDSGVCGSSSSFVSSVSGPCKPLLSGGYRSPQSNYSVFGKVVVEISSGLTVLDFENCVTRSVCAGNELRRTDAHKSTPLNVRWGQPQAQTDTGVIGSYIDIGNCEWVCEYCRATFWYGERVKKDGNFLRPRYHRCCGGGKVVCKWPREPPAEGDPSQLDPEFMSTLICLLDEHNELVRLFHAARDRVESGNVLEFHIRLFSIVGAREYDLPTLATLGLIVFKNGPNTRTDYDVIIKSRGGFPQRVNKLHPSYMSLQFPLLFVYGEPGFYLGGRLFQQYVVGVFCSIEQNRLDFYRLLQNDIRREYLSGVHAAISRGDREGSQVGSRLILPMTFTRGPRYMYSHYLDALAICRVLGNPQYFVTFTCNVNRPEIKRYMLQFLELTPADRADIVVHVFQQKTENVERTSQRNLSHTFFDADGYVHYRRRETHTCASRRGVDLDNGYIVPYNRQLCLAFQAHINVKSYGWSMFIKYLFKYISKGTDKIAAKIVRQVGDPPADTNNGSIQIDEIYNYIDGRFVCPYEACWRILKYDIHGRQPAVQILSVHLEDTKSWRRRQRRNSGLIGRLANVHPTKQYTTWYFMQLMKTKQEMIFVYGHGGTGKTSLWRTLINSMRSEGKIVLAVASLGIASLLLPAGRTAHSRFKLPLDLTDESLCNIKKNTNAASLLAKTSLIIWDESPMNDIRCFEALDMTLRDVLDAPKKLFGGKTIVLGGDFRQTLLVKKGASKPEIVSASIAASELWPHFKVCKLTENMRDGKTRTVEENNDDDSLWITVPEEFCIPDEDNGLKNLIGFIYDENTLQNPTAADLQQKAIVCPKNATADEINETVLEMLHGKSMVYTSSDEAIHVGSDRGEVELLYPPEYLNTLQFLGFPSHRLELKVRAPIMLLRNMNLQGGMCNGTQMIIKKLSSRLIEGEKQNTGSKGVQKMDESESTKDDTTDYCCILIDKEANMGTDDIPYFESLLHEGSAEEFEKMEQPVIFAISSCNANIYGGTPATHYYFNPEIPGLEELREQYRQRLTLHPPLQISKERCSDINSEKNKNRFPFSTLLQQNPNGYRSVRFTCEATITSVVTSRDWYYQSCNDCIGKVYDGNGEAYCVKHGVTKPPNIQVHFQGVADRPVGYSFGHILYSKCRRVDRKQLH
uniref:ATP-dependent DNA helicase n=1 Tax=Tanacetum cinerariifolium TaxID=118510 RepID=A0A6L2JVA5_TANCI|nr:DNA helicase [Tanacetum cinerariifolium]